MSSQNPFEITPLDDNPINDARLLGHDTIVTTLKNFIESKHMISASSVAVDGDWGSGKTSIMKTIAERIDKEKTHVLFFEAWKHEYTNPALGLVVELSKLLGNRDLANKIIEIAAFLLLEKLTQFPFQDLVTKIRDEANEPVNFHKSIQEIANSVGKRLVIIIDDLDRCDIENTLQILALMKLFLSVNNCVTIAAVDFERLQQAWKIKYKTTDGQDDSKNYLDKIFQVRIAIPEPSKNRVIEYYGHITKNMPDELLEILSNIGPKNPRAIKRLLNLISFRTFLLDNEQTRLYSSCIWTILEFHMGNESLVYFTERLIANGKTIPTLIYGSGWNDTHSAINRIMSTKKMSGWDMDKLRKLFDSSHALLNRIGISESDFKKDLEILYDNTKETIKNKT
jgi:predicted KAP-like P-loop ATPase